MLTKSQQLCFESIRTSELFTNPKDKHYFNFNHSLSFFYDFISLIIMVNFCLFLNFIDSIQYIFYVWLLLFIMWSLFTFIVVYSIPLSEYTSIYLSILPLNFGLLQLGFLVNNIAMNILVHVFYCISMGMKYKGGMKHQGWNYCSIAYIFLRLQLITLFSKCCTNLLHLPAKYENFYCSSSTVGMLIFLISATSVCMLRYVIVGLIYTFVIANKVFSMLS